MKKNPFSQSLALPLLLGSALTGLLVGCGGSSGSDNDDQPKAALEMPGELHLSLIDANTGAYYLFDTDSETLTDLNELAKASDDSAVQNLQITDTSTIGHFFHWPDFRLVNGAEAMDSKYLLMRPDYVAGSTIDASQFVQLAHFHDDALAAHSGEEFANPPTGSAQEAGLLRLNDFVNEQQALEAELREVMPDGETLCRAFVDPVQAFEASLSDAADETAEDAADDHAHSSLVHIALSDSGRLYFFAEGESGLAQIQGFVTLDNVESISDCNRASIARASDDGVLVFVPDAQQFYLVDSHGGDYHQHSRWNVADLLPEGVRADLVAVLGTGGAHEHE